MDFRLNHRNNNSSPSSSSNSSSTPNPLKTTPSAATATTTATTAGGDDPMHSWWESVSKARSRIHALATILPSSSSDSLLTLADSDRPALSLLSSSAAYSAVSDVLSSPQSGSGSDPLCQWLYDTFLSADPHLRLVVLSYIPLLSGLYLTRIHAASSDSPSLLSLAGFEAVLLALYAAETKSRAGKPVLVTIPDLSQPSIYHAPLKKPGAGAGTGTGAGAGFRHQTRPSVGVVSAPLEPQVAVKSTKRACIVGVALDSYYKQISQMPSWSKLEFCQFAAGWAGQDCPCRREFDHGDENVNENGHRNGNGNEVHGFSNGLALKDGDSDDDGEIEEVVEEMGNLQIQKYDFALELPKGARIPLPWELLQPVLRILGHCLLAPLNSQDVKDAASFAVRCLYARASHDLVPQSILATRSLIQLDKRAREAAKAAAATAAANSSSNANTPSKAKKPEILLVSK